MRSISLAIVFAFCIPFALRAQLSGTYSINSGAAASATNYTTVGAAISDLMTGTRSDGGPAQGPGVSAAVTLRIATGTGPYNEQISIGNIPGSSATNFVRLTGGPTRATIQFTGTTTTNRHVIRLDGAKHIRLDSLTITNNDPSFGYGVWLTNAADSNFVTNSLVNVSTTATSSSFAGITISGTAVTSNGNFGNYNTITGNVVTGGYYGITCRGTSTTVYGQANKINDNVIQQVYYYGIYSYYENLTEILRNDISYRATATTSGYAMYVYYNDRFKIERNHLDNLSLYGIYVVYGNIQGGSPTSRARIANNMVGGSWLGTTPYCIYLATNCTDIDVFHNSISATSGNGRGIYVTSGSGNALVNNSVSMTNSTTAYAMYVTSAANVSTVNYNNYWAPGSSNFVYIASAYTPATFVGGGGFNANSLNLNPNYASSSDLHIGSGTNLYNVGTNVGVTEDFDGQVRPLNGGYEIGADEYSPAANDVGPLSMTSPLQPFAPGTLPVSIVLRNYGTSTLTSAVVDWKVNGVPQLSFNFAGSVAPATNSSAQTLGSANFPPGVATNLEFITSMPNGGPDANVVNDTLRVSVCPSLAGTYTIGGGGADFPTINAAVDALVCGGVSAPVTMRLNNSASPFLEQVIIPSIPGASATNNIRFTGGPAMATVLFTGTTTTQRAVIKLIGAKHVTLDSLTITNADGVYGYGVHLTNAADSNAVTNCNVTVNSTATVTNFAGITISGNLVADNGNFGNYNTISGNTVTGGYYGIACRGTSATVFCQGNKINGNRVQQTYYYGMAITYVCTEGKYSQVILIK